MTKKYVSMTSSVVNAVIWGYAVFFACKWFGHMLNGVISFNSPSDAVFLIVTGTFAVAGAIIAFLFAVLNFRDKISLAVQLSVLLMGMLAMWSIYSADSMV
jgi:uncharacterized protein YhhL (DUF1145 family)